MKTNIKKAILFFLVNASIICNLQIKSHADVKHLESSSLLDENQNIVLKEVKATFSKVQIDSSPYPCIFRNQLQHELDVDCNILSFSHVTLYDSKTNKIFYIEELVFPFSSNIKDILDKLNEMNSFNTLAFKQIIFSNRLTVKQISKNNIRLALGNFQFPYLKGTHLKLGFANSKAIENFVNAKNEKREMVIRMVSDSTQKTIKARTENKALYDFTGFSYYCSEDSKNVLGNLRERMADNLRKIAYQIHERILKKIDFSFKEFSVDMTGHLLSAEPGNHFSGLIADYNRNLLTAIARLGFSAQVKIDDKITLVVHTSQKEDKRYIKNKIFFQYYHENKGLMNTTKSEINNALMYSENLDKKDGGITHSLTGFRQPEKEIKIKEMTGKTRHGWPKETWLSKIFGVLSIDRNIEKFLDSPGFFINYEGDPGWRWNSFTAKNGDGQSIISDVHVHDYIDLINEDSTGGENILSNATAKYLDNSVINATGAYSHISNSEITNDVVSVTKNGTGGRTVFLNVKASNILSINSGTGPLSFFNNILADDNLIVLEEDTIAMDSVFATNILLAGDRFILNDIYAKDTLFLCDSGPNYDEGIYYFNNFPNLPFMENLMAELTQLLIILSGTKVNEGTFQKELENKLSDLEEELVDEYKDKKTTPKLRDLDKVWGMISDHEDDLYFKLDERIYEITSPNVTNMAKNINAGVIIIHGNIGKNLYGKAHILIAPREIPTIEYDVFIPLAEILSSDSIEKADQ